MYFHELYILLQIFGQKSSEANSEVSLSPNVELGTPWWRNVRVFISSTFRDMHGERDLLTRYVFPELRSRAMQHFINIYEIDLRWGITDDQSTALRYLVGTFAALFTQM